MSTPAPPPRHLPHGSPTGPGGLSGGRQAARIRAIVTADLLPEERASADALVLTAWLTAGQRARYATSLRAGPDTEEFAERLADERRVVLEEGADPVADELESAAEAERAARQLPLRILEGTLLAMAVGSFALFVLTDVLDGGAASSLARAAVPYAAVMALAGLLAAVVGAVATHRRDRRLLDWAVSRPGQLGRGLPLRRPLQGESAGPAVAAALGPAVLVAAGVLGIVAGAAILLITLMLGDEQGWAAAAPWLLGGGALALIVAVTTGYLRGRRQLRAARRSRAVEWFGASAP
ncbi:hypothetical protein [Brachybacterium sp. YJGR34]|uniref:hypothetical protein n=1 Tax=Brachybacterium sp. YJGR34 TaxID=2059911 RepID=UPI000E0C6455|nr:hypothetical protein [Brachybacterium sp. YJGR34]